MAKQLFLLGTGFIGGSLLRALLDDKQNEYKISALVREESKIPKLQEVGVRVVKGSLDSDEIIAEEASRADVVLHAATADDLRSVKSILKGLSQRDVLKEPAVYIHTSGIGVLTHPTQPDSVVFNDKAPEMINSLVADDAPHRRVDLFINEAVEGGKLNARISIILPPDIFGIGSGPFNQISIQVPSWIKRSVEDGKVTIWGGEHRWSNIHIKNLIPAYLLLLSHLSSLPASSPPPPLYIFPETGSHLWRDVGLRIDLELKKHSLLPPNAQVVEAEGVSEGMEGVGTQARTRGEWLREWGWRVDEKLPLILESVPKEIEEMRRLGRI